MTNFIVLNTGVINLEEMTHIGEAGSRYEVYFKNGTKIVISEEVFWRIKKHLKEQQND